MKIEPCLIGIEACTSAHFWARKLIALGHSVKLMPLQYVKTYVKTNKNDAADAEAICEAVTRPNMRFVQVKNIDQQTVLSLHRARQGFVKARTAMSNQIRGLMAEFCLETPVGLGYISSRVPALIEDASNELSGIFRQLIQGLLEHFKALQLRVVSIEEKIVSWQLPLQRKSILKSRQPFSSTLSNASHSR